MAVLLHTFYVDYRVHAKAYLVSWPATFSQRKAVLDSEAHSLVRPRRERRYEVAGTSLYEQKEDFVSRYCEVTELYRRKYRNANIMDIPFADPEDSDYYRCSRKFVPKKPEVRIDVTSGVSFAAARARVEQRYASKQIRFGMVPSVVVAGDEPSQTSFVKSYWLGVLVPAASLLFTVFLLIGAIRGGGSKAQVRSPDKPAGDAERALIDAKEILGLADAEEVSQGMEVTLAELIKSDFGPDFPVSGGNGKEHSPLVITATRDYVSVEYAVVRHVLTSVGEEYELSKQALLSRDGKMIDKLTFKVKEDGSAEWQGQRNFYFDVTAGLSA